MAGKGDAIFKRGMTWYIDVQINKRRFQKKLGKGISRTTALKYAQAVRTDILNGTFGFVKKKDLRFEEAWAAYEACFTKEKRPLTVKTYRECGRRLKESFTGKMLSQISQIAVEKHKHDRKEAGAKVRANREVACLKKLFNYCRANKLYEGTNPVTSVEFFSEPRGKDRVLSEEEEAALLANCREPLKTMVLVGLYCGVRMRSELLTLKWENLDLIRKNLTIIGAYAKNKKVRVVPVFSRVAEALARLPHPPTAEWVFTKPNGIPYRSVRGFRTACRKAGLTKVTPHTLRHTCASRLVAAGVDPITITKMMGWSSIKMLDRYAHADPTRMADAVERAFHVPSIPLPSEIRRIRETA